MKLSLCIATFNEEKFLHYPLDSAYDFVDEVVIVDGGSTDKTISIAAAYGKKIRVIKTTNPPMFHLNKQKAIEAAKGEWILQLDADEELSDELKKEIKETVRGKAKADAYWLSRKNFFLGRFLTKGGVYPDRTIRLYRNGIARFPSKSVHENVEVTGKVGYLKNDLLHFADPKFSRYLKRWKRYNNLDAQLLVDEGKKPGFLNYFIVKPLWTFIMMYGRHKGFMDGWQGFVFAFFSSIRFAAIYLHYQQLKKKARSRK
jgi:glycosyltransferase involved in cell wall biosynthesis